MAWEKGNCQRNCLAAWVGYAFLGKGTQKVTAEGEWKVNFEVNFQRKMMV